MNDRCFAPVFEGSEGLACFARQIGYIFYLIILIFFLALTAGTSRSIRCLIQQILFRISHCREGNSDPAIILPLDAYERHVQDFKNRFSKSNEWELWMLDNRGRYIGAFNISRNLPSIINISFNYETEPIAYDPPWTDENEHMSTLESLAEGCFATYNFNFNFNGDTESSYANVIAGIASTTSHASGKNMYVYYEGIFNHEFGHFMGISHHYDDSNLDTIGDGLHMPPGDTICIMDRTFNQYCSGCRTALNIPLDIDNQRQIEITTNDINRRYPY